jgi:uncharacterized membrane protein
MDIVPVIFGSLKLFLFLGFLLLLFIPGFALSLVIFPRLTDPKIFDRLVYSAMLSIVSDIGLVLFMGVVPGLEPTLGNLILVVCVFSDGLLMVWLCERWYLNRRLKKHSVLQPHIRSNKNMTEVENKLQVELIRKLQKNIQRDLNMFNVPSDSFKGSQKNIEHILIPKNADVNKKLSEAEDEMRDLNWLYE